MKIHLDLDFRSLELIRQALVKCQLLGEEVYNEITEIQKRQGFNEIIEGITSVRVGDTTTHITGYIEEYRAVHIEVLHNKDDLTTTKISWYRIG